MTRVRSALGGICLICCLAGTAFGQSTGPDVLVGELPDLSNNTGETDANGVAYDAFAVGTTSCNKGNTGLNWFTGGTDNRHPVIGQNLFRLVNGRFEQVGQSWLKHGFTALQGNVCNLGCTANPDGTKLGPGCSDPYSSGLNNGQSGLGPKWQVNASTGLFPYPFSSPSFSGTTARRLKVRDADVSTTTYPGALYFVEGQYVCGDDAGAGNKNNNASWRQVTVSGGTMAFAAGSSTHREQAAIYAWQASDASVSITTFDVPNDGRYILACKVSGTGPYTYEYALHNLNSHRSAGSFTVPLPGTQAALTGVGFHDAEYHSGEPNQLANTANPDADNWTASGGGANATGISWSGPAYAGTPPAYTVSGTTPYLVTSYTAGTGNDHSANVLRWGTLFNFRFTSEVAPAAGNVSVGLWRPGQSGDPSSFLMAVQTPGGATVGVITGSCCVGQSCTVTAQTACSGTWSASGTCSPNPCITGSCCTTAGACTVTTASGCTATWTSGASCSPNPCPQPTGSCCVSGACTVTTQTACSGGWTTGGVCSPNPCTTGSCCTTAGACSITTQANCTATWTAGATTCTPNPCPQPTGSCCVTSNCSVTTQAACSGTWNSGASCTPNPCSAGVNDACANAIPLCDGTAYSGTTVGATNDGTASCGASATSPDVWFSYAPSGTSGTVSVTITLCGSGYDTVLSLYTGSCGALTQVGCNDDSTCSGSATFQSTVTASLTRGVTYRIRVAGYQGATGLYTILVTGGTGTGCNTTGRCCIGTACTLTTQSGCTGTWGTGTCTPNPCDPTGTCCVGTSCAITTQTACTGTFTAGATCGVNTCDPLGSCCEVGNCNSTTASGCANGTWTSNRACSPNPCPPQTDNCADRAGVSLGATPFDTTNATTDGPTHALCLGSNDNNIAKDVWFNFPCTFDGSIDVSTCGSSFDTKLAVYDGYGCANLDTRIMACNDDFACGGANTLQSQVTISVLCGHHYTIRIGGYTNGSGATASGTGTLTITGTPASTGSCCAADGSCTETYQSCCSATWTSGAVCSPNPCPQPTGACCNPNTGVCSIATHLACGAAQSLYQGDGSSCTPNPCPQPTGACCCGSTCTITLPSACTGTGRVFVGSGIACTPFSATVPCCRGDYNHSGALSVQDLFDFLAGYFANDPCANSNDTVDGNGAATLSVQDLFDFLAAYFGGC